MNVKTTFLFICIATICLAIPTHSLGKKRHAKQAPLKIGQAAPAFELPDESGTKHALADYKGKKVVLYFYPKNNSPQCTKQACSLRDGFSELKDANITIIGISFDTAKSHKKFKEKHALPFLLLSDTDKKVARLYGATGGWFGTPKRYTFLINEQRILVDILKNIDVSDHAQQIINQFNCANK